MINITKLVLMFGLITIFISSSVLAEGSGGGGTSMALTSLYEFKENNTTMSSDLIYTKKEYETTRTTYLITGAILGLMLGYFLYGRKRKSINETNSMIPLIRRNPIDEQTELLVEIRDTLKDMNSRK